MSVVQSRMMVADDVGGVLLISQDIKLADGLRKVLAMEGLRLEVAGDAETARDLLNQDEYLSFVIGDIPEQATLSDAIATLRHNRLHIAWARLPAVVLVPAAIFAERDRLAASGVMGDLLPKPVNARGLVERITSARFR